MNRRFLTIAIACLVAIEHALVGPLHRHDDAGAVADGSVHFACFDSHHGHVHGASRPASACEASGEREMASRRAGWRDGDNSASSLCDGDCALCRALGQFLAVSPSFDVHRETERSVALHHDFSETSSFLRSSHRPRAPPAL